MKGIWKREKRSAEQKDGLGILGMRMAVVNRAAWEGLVEKGIPEQRLEEVREFLMRISEGRSIPGRTG